MIRKMAFLFIGFALLFVSGAEAMSGYCDKLNDAAPQMVMSDHCAEMMKAGSDMSMDERAPVDAPACCCLTVTAPILFELTFVEGPIVYPPSWALEGYTTGLSVPSKVAIPPPRI